MTLLGVLMLLTPTGIPQTMPIRSEAVSFMQNAILNKAGGACSSESTEISPAYTQYGPIGGGTATSSYSIYYWQTSDPAVDEHGTLHIVYLQIFASFTPGVFKGSSSKNVAMYEEELYLPRVAPSSIDVVKGTCGDGVTFSGTAGQTIGMVHIRNRKVKANIPDQDLKSAMTTKCNAKETEKKECSERQSEVSDDTIHFPSYPDMATRFSHALKDVVILSGGKPDSY